MKKNKIIVIDGVDGAGKTTQVNILKQLCPEFKFAKLPWYESNTGIKIADYLNGKYENKEFDNIYQIYIQ